MKFLFSLVFMIPIVFFCHFWFVQLFFFILSFFFIIMFSFSFEYLNVSYFFGCDLLSYSLILLSFWICSLMILASGPIYSSFNYYQLFLFFVLILMFSLICTFSSVNLFVFYLFFEISLVPTLFLIIGWGAQPERLQAGYYLMFYTLLASLPMLISLFYLYNKEISLDYFFLMDFYDSFLLFFCMNFVFFIKAPMFMVHLWLPKAHVEAPVSGSMILAGVMLKLGTYGMIRVFSLFMGASFNTTFLFISISMIGGVLVSFICLRQSDIKSLIAYSSVSHMGLVLSGILTFNYWGLAGAFLMMIAHGLCSSGLFCLANISYERMGSRSLFLNKGLMGIVPSMSLWWFLFCACNMAAPPSLNLVGEIILINSLISWSSFSVIPIVFVSFFGAVYSLFLYSFSQHGKIYGGIFSVFSGYVREYLLLFLHWFPLNLLIFKSEFFLFFN
uniref:NADH-ubiquinone oxidoreductase chain 4 n=1 Tax=Attagenus augustatus augustatus TaxID=2783534 RepID=A0A7S6UAZ1_9COLE|nr:NADH dehydrogenase subunit 4 [Attagenus augustatus augustatus]